MLYTLLATLGYVCRRGARVLPSTTKRGGDQQVNTTALAERCMTTKTSSRMKRGCAKRGIECASMSLRGTISWPGFGKGGEHWFGFIFRIDAFEGGPLRENDEGPLEWIDVARIMELPLWEGDRYFLPLVFAEDLRQFHGVMPYRDGHPVSWTYSVV